MKYIQLFIFVLFAFQITAQDQSVLPAVQVNTFDGESVNLQEYTKNGKVQLVNLWATWCGPCRQELAALKTVHAEWKEKYDLEIVAVTMDNKRALKRAIKMAEDNEWPYTFFHDAKGAIAGHLGLRGIPFSAVVDGDGQIIARSEGYFDGYEAKIEGILKALK